MSDSSYSSARLYGGNDNGPHRWPSAVRMQMTDPFANGRRCKTEPCGLCGGVILNPNWIMTAAHCCYGTNQFRRTPRPLNSISFQVGGHYDPTCTIPGIKSNIHRAGISSTIRKKSYILLKTHLTKWMVCIDAF